MIKLCTDTSANLPSEIIKKHHIGVIPFSYTIDGKHHEEKGGDFDGMAFYRAMREGADVRTSMINPTAYKEYFEGLLAGGSDVIYISMSGGISGSAAAARFAADELAEEHPDRRIAVIDSLGASLGEGLQVIEAAKLLEGGVDFDGVVSHISSNLQKMCQYFTVDDLHYLHKGGRLSSGGAIVGSLLNIKPILMGDAEGKIVSCGKVRGRKAALDALADKFDKLALDKSGTVGIAHADDDAAAYLLISKLREKGFDGECIKVCYEPVTGAHVGPGTLALFFRGEHK